MQQDWKTSNYLLFDLRFTIAGGSRYTPIDTDASALAGEAVYVNELAYSEQSCRAHFRFQREDEGVVCKNCGGMHQYWLKAKEQWQCATCGFRSTLKSGSMMEGSKL